MLQAKRKKEIKCGGLNSVTVAESNTGHVCTSLRGADAGLAY